MWFIRAAYGMDANQPAGVSEHKGQPLIDLKGGIEMAVQFELPHRSWMASGG